MKIPTLLALALLAIAIGLGVFVYQAKVSLDKQKSQAFQAKDIAIYNLTDNSISISWQTDIPTTGEISYGQGINLTNHQLDDRDLTKPTAHLIHFVTIKNLTSNTRYNFKIISQRFAQPSQTFQTAKTLENNPHPLSPIVGTIVDQSLKPIDEALVVLKVPGAQPQAAITTAAGNYILPISTLRTDNLSSFFDFGNQTTATLIIQNPKASSQVSISLPLNSPALPPIQLGQNASLTDYTASASATINLPNPTLQPSPSASTNPYLKISSKNKYDLNNDGVVNTIDLSIMLDVIKEKQYIKALDFNNDGKVDQQDVNQLKQNL